MLATVRSSTVELGVPALDEVVGKPNVDEVEVLLEVEHLQSCLVLTAMLMKAENSPRESKIATGRDSLLKLGFFKFIASA